jgi:hypothetical protein
MGSEKTPRLEISERSSARVRSDFEFEEWNFILAVFRLLVLGIMFQNFYLFCKEQ